MTAWIETHTGVAFPFEGWTFEDIRFADIAHSLSNICRYGGHCARFYSVAEHSIYVQQLLAERGASLAVQMGGLLHDAGETYVTDVPTPLEDYAQGLKLLDRVLMRDIFEKYGGEDAPLIHECDKIALASEATALLRCVNGWLDRHPAPAAWLVENIRRTAPKPDEVRQRFALAFGALRSAMNLPPLAEEYASYAEHVAGAWG